MPKTFIQFELGKSVSFDVIRNNNRNDDVCVSFGNDDRLQLCFATTASARKFCADLAAWLDTDDQWREERRRAFLAAKPKNGLPTS